MAFTVLELPPEKLKTYRPGEAVRKRKAKTRAEVMKRRRRAMSIARKAAELLKTEFGAKEVILFGSLARRGSFSLHSDIDLAARGIQPSKFYAAGAALDRFSMDFQIDLVDPKECSPAMLAEIEKDGKPL